MNLKIFPKLLVMAAILALPIRLTAVDTSNLVDIATFSNPPEGRQTRGGVKVAPGKVVSHESIPGLPRIERSGLRHISAPNAGSAKWGSSPLTRFYAIGSASKQRQQIFQTNL